MVLTERQRVSLEGAILEYLRDAGYEAAFTALQNDIPTTPFPRIPKYLEKKWTTVVKLEKKIQDFEKTVARLEQELQNTNPMSSVFTSRNRNQDSVPQTTRNLLAGHRKPITCVKFHPSFGVLISASEDATLRVWEPDTGTLEKVLQGHTKCVNDFDYHPDGTKIASCSNDLTVKIWDFNQEFRCTRTLSGHEHTVSQVCYADGGDKIVSVSRDKTIKVWEADTGYCIKTLTGHGDWVRVVTCLPQTNFIATASFDKTVRTWDIQSGNCTQEIRDFDNHVECLALSNPYVDAAILREQVEEIDDNDLYIPRFVAVGTRDNFIRIYDLINGECVMNLNGHENWVRAITFHPNGKFLVSVSDDRSIRVWDLKKQRTHFTYDDAHDAFVTSCSWNPALPMFATGGADKLVKVWNCD